MLARVLVSVGYILDRLSGPPTRASELRDLRRRLLAQPGPGAASPAEEQLALQLRDLRESLAASFGPVEACAGCAQPSSAVWPGGHCCSANTRELFSDHELAALRLAGTTPADLKPPRGGHLGCAFRGRSGCSLGAAHRPCVCVGYACRELQVELYRRGDGSAYVRLEEALHSAFERFVAQRQARMGTSLFQELEAGLAAAASIQGQMGSSHCTPSMTAFCLTGSGKPSMTQWTRASNLRYR